MRAIKDAFVSTLPADYFRALYDDPEEADAMFNLHMARVMDNTTPNV